MSEGVGRAYIDVQKLRVGMELRIEKLRERKLDCSGLEHILHHLEATEDVAEKELRDFAKSKRVWEEWFSKVKGIGPTLAGLLLSMVDARKFNTVAKMWKYTGLAVDEEGRAERFRRGKKASFNPLLKGIMLGRVGVSLIRMKGVWYNLYRKFKEEYLRRPDLKAEIEKGAKGAKLHVELMARRKMVKTFLACYWHVHRQIHGYSIEPEKVRRATYLNPYLMVDK